MELQFLKYDPCGNTTVLVTSPVPRDRYGDVAAQLMRQGHVGCEQVGYVEPARAPGAWARLAMMGGEFCGNASMCMAAMLASEMSPGLSEAVSVPLEVSGARGIVTVRAARDGCAWRCRVDMPLPIDAGERNFPRGDGVVRLPYVAFEGIAFALSRGELSPEEAERLIPLWHKDFGGDAFGILLLDAEMRAMRPLVRVAATGTSVWEHGCGSGTSAVGAAMALASRGSVDRAVRQPGGEIRVRAVCEGRRIATLSIEGTVRPVCRGTAFLPDAE